MIKSNFHTHSTYCDGKDNLESIVQCAIKKGFKYLGFSSHSYIEGDDFWTLKKDAFIPYVNEVLSLKEKYESEITILLGIEQDTLSNIYDYKFDYVIGSMHSIEKGGKTYSLDYSLQSFKFLLEEIYLNDYDSLCKDYFNQIKNLSKTNANVVGHFDLITKYSEKIDLPLPKYYLKYAEDSIIEILKSITIFEINTGAISKNYRTKPYPSKEILELIFKHGGKIMINTDCHKKENLDCGLDIAVNLAKEVGYKTSVIITSEGEKEIIL